MRISAFDFTITTNFLFEFLHRFFSVKLTVSQRDTQGYFGTHCGLVLSCSTDTIVLLHILCKNFLQFPFFYFVSFFVSNLPFTHFNPISILRSVYLSFLALISFYSLRLSSVLLCDNFLLFVTIIFLFCHFLCSVPHGNTLLF